MIRKTITAIKNYFTDNKQETDTIFKPLAKLPVEQPKRVTMHFKTKTIEARSHFMNILLFEIMQDMIEFAREELGIEAVITETVTTPAEDKRAGRKSVTHQQGRAFDMRSLGWRIDQIDKFTKHFLGKYGKFGALRASNGEPNLIFHHNVGLGPHFHVQIKAEYTVANLQQTLKERGVA